jgi:spore germination cell wall hydrolase CwlJ-like protein
VHRAVLPSRDDVPAAAIWDDRPPPGAEGEAVFYMPPARANLASPRTLAALLVLVLGLAVAAAVAALVLLGRAPEPGRGGGPLRPVPDRASASLAAAPPVAEVTFLDVPRETARQINAAIPFSTEPNPAAAPLRLTLSALDRSRALDCLAAALWYEAGDDALGQESVGQVVINRLRHPSFPASVCGVVFQGSARATGCQFTFTCDGSMARRTPAPAAWGRAQAMAAALLGGTVFAPVGWSTHYHTDWVVPNWNRSVVKAAQIRTHLFYRWPGGSGRPGAFRQPHAGTEPEIALMRPLSLAHRGLTLPEDALSGPENEITTVPAPSAAAAPPPAGTPTELRGASLAAVNPASGVFVVTIAPDTFAGSLALTALDLCRARTGACTVVGFKGAARRVDGGAFGRVRWEGGSPDFYYFSDRSRARELVYWNCATFERRNKAQCLPPGFQPEG